MKLKMLENPRSFGTLEIGTVFQKPGCPNFFIKIFVSDNKGTYGMDLESGTTISITNFGGVIPLGKFSSKLTNGLTKIRQVKHFSNLVPGDVFRIEDAGAVYMKLLADHLDCVDLSNGRTIVMQDQTFVTLIHGVFEEDNDGDTEEK